MDLNGSVAVVTGGGAGIGRAICLRLAADGARVAVLDIRLETAETDTGARRRRRHRARLRCERQRCRRRDLRAHRGGARPARTSWSTTRGAIGIDHLRRVTPLLARQRAEAADGGVRTPLDALVRLTDDEWRRMLAIHLDGTFYCTRAAVRSMAPRGRGVIVNMASICGLEGCTGHPHYSAAKARHPRVHQGGGKELIVQGIRVNARGSRARRDRDPRG